jgi:hypothetical protein
MSLCAQASCALIRGNGWLSIKYNGLGSTRQRGLGDRAGGRASRCSVPGCVPSAKLSITRCEPEPVKWIFSTKMATHKALTLFKLNSHAKMAPDNHRLTHPRADVETADHEEASLVSRRLKSTAPATMKLLACS